MSDVRERTIKAMQGVAMWTDGAGAVEGELEPMLDALADAGLVIVNREDVEVAISELTEWVGVLFGQYNDDGGAVYPIIKTLRAALTPPVGEDSNA